MNNLFKELRYRFRILRKAPDSRWSWSWRCACGATLLSAGVDGADSGWVWLLCFAYAMLGPHGTVSGQR